MVAMLTSAVLATGVAACRSEPEPDPAADALAQALSSGKFGSVPLRGATGANAAEQVTEMAGDLDEANRTVRVTSIEELEDGRQRASLDIAWELPEPADPWRYNSAADLVPTEDDGWEVTWTPRILHPRLTEGDQLTLRREQAQRGEILGPDGSPIVTDRTVFRIGIDKTQVEEPDQAAAATELAELLDIDVDNFTSQVESSGPQAFVEGIILREEDATDARSAIVDIEGAIAVEDTLPLAPTRRFARPLLGTVGSATAEIIDESGGDVVQGDLVGLSGLQHQYDEELRGEPGFTIQRVPEEGDPEVLHEQAPQDGTSVSVTLDTELQTLAENTLAAVEPASALVAIQPSTGEVRAAASGPGSDGYSTATLGQYPPGSTFKLVTALALLRAGLTPDSTVDCPTERTVDGRTFTNYSDYPSSGIGEISLRSAIANSCNTAMIGQHDAVSPDDLADAAAALGLGVERDLGVPAFLGDVPTDTGGTGHAAALIGQGRVLASPLALSTMAASVAAGETVTPQLLAEPVDRDGETTEADGSDAADNAGQAGLEAGEAETLRGLMRAVVEDGTAQFLSDVPGEPVGAKTGTAEYGTETPPATHAWMVGVQGDLAVAVFVADGESGSQTAGPLLDEFLRSR